MNKKLKIILTASVVVVGMFLAMFVFSEVREREVKQAVITYIDVLKKAHLESNPSLMRPLTSDWQLKKINSYIAFNIESRRLVNGNLKEITFNEITIDDDIATVVTTERWIWHYINPVSREQVSRVFDEVNGSTYHMKKSEGGWIVDNIISDVIEKDKV
jgi:hypothetical protein